MWPTCFCISWALNLRKSKMRVRVIPIILKTLRPCTHIMSTHSTMQTSRYNTKMDRTFRKVWYVEQTPRFVLIPPLGTNRSSLESNNVGWKSIDPRRESSFALRIIRLSRKLFTKWYPITHVNSILVSINIHHIIRLPIYQ